MPNSRSSVENNSAPNPVAPGKVVLLSAVAIFTGFLIWFGIHLSTHETPFAAGLDNQLVGGSVPVTSADPKFGTGF